MTGRDRSLTDRHAADPAVRRPSGFAREFAARPGGPADIPWSEIPAQAIAAAGPGNGFDVGLRIVREVR
jgi:hypothetical protein